MGFAGNNAGLEPHLAAEKAVSVIGLGFDICKDIRFSACKKGPSASSLIAFDSYQTRDLVFPGGVVVPNVPTSIKCDKGERTRFRSDVLKFNQMSELFNKELGLSGKVPSGQFNVMFDMKKGWPKDAACAKTLALDGWFITLYNIELSRSNITLSEELMKEVPSSWNPPALAEFIANYGTHVVVGVKMGGKDVIHMKQSKKSDLEPEEMQRLLKQLAEERFFGDSNQTLNVNATKISAKLEDDHAKSWGFRKSFPFSGRPIVKSHSKNDDIQSITVRKGGIDAGQSFNEWLSTISQSPNVISMSFVPITSLLSSSVPGSIFLSHAVNLYLRYKPPIEELHQFLEFQLPRLWAPMYGDLPLGYGHIQRRNPSPSLQFSPMGPKLFVNTAKVDTKNRPVTGIRLYLEGRKNDHLAIHLQHLSEIPSILDMSYDHSYNPTDEPVDKAYYEPVKWNCFSHVCTAPVQYNTTSQLDEAIAIVTMAWLEVKQLGMKNILFLRLGFSSVSSARIRRSEWDGASTMSRKSGFFSSLMSTRLSKDLMVQNAVEKSKVNINSAVYEEGPPVPTRAQKMLNLVDTKEMVRGPEDVPGYWVVTGARLCVEDGRISLRAKYTLLTIMSEESQTFMRA